MASSTLPPDLFDQTTIISLLSTVAILAAALALSRQVLAPDTSRPLRFLFVWHAFDALLHFTLEGSFLYHCFFSAAPAAAFENAHASSGHHHHAAVYYPDARNFLGTNGVAHGSQAGGSNPFAQLWMVYARADRRWAGADLNVVSLELLTVFIVAPMACLVCYDIAKKNARASIGMVILATSELYGGFMTFCPEWLVGSINLDTSNFMYLWVYLVFFNTLWVFIPLYAIYVSVADITDAFRVRANVLGTKKTN